VTAVAIFGGHASGLLVADSVRVLAASGEPVEVLGFLNDAIAAGDRIGPHRVLCGFDEWRRLQADVRFLAAFPSPGAARERHARLRALGVPPDRWIAVIDPAARVSPLARVARGCFAGPNAVVEHGADIGEHTMVRGGAYVSHDVRVGEFGFVGPNATLLGRAVCGAGVHVGANAVCREGTVIGDYAMVGIGAVVTADVPAGAVVAGNPARVIGDRSP